MYDDYLAIEEAVIERTPDDFTLGETKTKKSRYLAITPFVTERLNAHKLEQNKRIIKTKDYNRDNNLVVADKKGHVPDIKYIRRYMMRKAEEAGISQIPPKNLRTTHISLMNDLGIPLPTIQKQVGHAYQSPVTQKHYIRNYYESLRHAAMIFHDRLHNAEN